MSSFRGSEWRKWDLHVHTPASIVHEYSAEADGDIWEKYINELEKLPQDIKVIGINDYLFLDGYEKILSYRKSGRLKNIELVLPVIEFRLKEFVGNAKLGRINYHIIFSDELSVDTIRQQFLTQLYGHAKLDPTSSHHSWSGALSRQSMIDLGTNIRTTTPTDKQKELPSDLELGFNNINFELSKIENLLTGSLYLKDKYLTAIGKTEWDDFRWDGSASDKKTLINGCNFVFVASPNDGQVYKSKNKLKEDLVNDKVLHCSDAHEFYTTQYTSKILGHCYTWIKANPTFEGLKQVIYEPSRVYIGENKPQSALHKLEEIKLGFDNNTKWGSDKFCFSEFESKLLFSPNLTCIIGGRGSGKSTLLNIIAEKIGKSDKDFFSKVIPQEIKSKIIFTPEVIDNIEFLAQNTIENFAKDSKEFTKAIFERLDKKSNGKLLEIEQENIEQLKAFDAHIKLLETRLLKHKELEEKKKELKKFESIVKTLTDKQYIKNKDELQKTQKQLIDLENSRKKYEELYTKLKEFTQDYKPIGEPKDNYQNYYNELVSDLSSLFDKYKNKNYEDVKKLMDDLKMKKSLHIQQIEEYLKSKGMNEDNIKDAQNASTSIEQIKSEILELKQAVMKIWRSKKQFNTDTIDKSIDEFKVKIESELEIINRKFIEIARKNSQDVKIIKVEYQQDSDVFDLIFDTFLSKLPEDIVKKIDKSTFRNYLKNIEPAAVLEFKKSKDFLKQIETSISKSSLSTQTYKGLEEVFGQEFNFQLYKLLIQKAIKNIRNSKLLNVSYDGKPLKNSSFGQRCTAAIVILLSLGNNPIIIDEPEAHLDSSLIANYLVELIKEQKQQRQIIFATHNANFVLNGDAELIIKLENTDGLTKSTSFAIEDIKYREDLLKLEGGREAFKKREQKYNI